MTPKELYQSVRRIQIRSKRAVNDVMAGMYQSAFKGEGMEFEEVREYLPGDEVRNIDWNVTARMQTPYVKNFREERELTLTLAIDVSASTWYGSSKKSKKALIAELGAILALSAIQNNDKVSLLLFSNQIESYLPPQKGSRHVLRVIRELLACQPREKGTGIRQALRFLGQVQKRRGICFLLSDFINEEYEKEVAVTSRKQDLIAIRISDPIEEALPVNGLITLRDLETGEEIIADLSNPELRNQLKSRYWERSHNVQRTLERVGASYIDLPTNEDPAHTLRRFLRQRERLAR